MKFIDKDSLVSKGPGSIKITPQTLEDLFFLYDKLLFPGLKISAATSRKVDASILSPSQTCRTISANSGGDYFGKRKPIRVFFDIEIMIMTVYPVDVSTSMIRIKGRCTTETEYLDIGDYHSLELELNKEFCLFNKVWDKISIGLLDQPPVPTKVLNKKEAAEKFEKFSTVMALKPNWICYGLKHIERACQAKAIQSLMVTDDLFRNQDVFTRRKYAELVDLVKTTKGQVFIFPPKDKNLCDITGVAALLRFPFSYCK